MRARPAAHALGTAAAAALLLAARLGAQEPVSRGAFVVRLGVDTIAVERFTRTATGLDADLVRRQPATMTLHYHADLAPDGRVTRLAVELRRPAGEPGPRDLRAVRVTFDGDSATVELQRDTVVRRRVATGADALPMLPESYALHEVWLARLRATHADTATMMLVAPLGGPQGRLAVRLVGRDSARAWVFGAPLRIRTDERGRLLGLDGTATTIKYQVERVRDADVVALARRFAAADAAGQPLGAWVSKRDTARASVGAAHLTVDYGRPAARGRDVFARGVLGDTLWRTGANAATQLFTDADLELGGRTLPAGSYTLWTHVSPAGYELVINTQTGQWGTEYHAERDLMRVPLAVARMGTPVEVFTIDVTPGDANGGLLRLRWDRTELSVPFTVRTPGSG